MRIVFRVLAILAVAICGLVESAGTSVVSAQVVDPKFRPPLVSTSWWTNGCSLEEQDQYFWHEDNVFGLKEGQHLIGSVLLEDDHSYLAMVVLKPEDSETNRFHVEPGLTQFRTWRIGESCSTEQIAMLAAREAQEISIFYNDIDNVWFDAYWGGYFIQIEDMTSVAHLPQSNYDRFRGPCALSAHVFLQPGKEISDELIYPQSWWRACYQLGSDYVCGHGNETGLVSLYPGYVHGLNHMWNGLGYQIVFACDQWGMMEIWFKDHFNTKITVVPGPHMIYRSRLFMPYTHGGGLDLPTSG